MVFKTAEMEQHIPGIYTGINQTQIELLQLTVIANHNSGMNYFHPISG